MKESKVNHIYRYLDTLGTGLGTKNGIGNYATPTPLFITPTTPGKQYVLHRVIIHVEDDANFNAGGYGGLGTLTNGVIVRVVRRDGTIMELTDGLPVKNNSDWARLCYDTSYDTFPSGNNYLHARWTFAKSGKPIVLNVGDQLQVVLHDNFSTMVGHYFMVQGYEQ